MRFAIIPKTEDHLGMLVAQAEISGTFKFIRDIYKMMGLSKPDLQIELPFAAPEQPATQKIYHDYYGTQVQLGAARAAFWFDEAILDIGFLQQMRRPLQSMKQSVWLNWNVWRKMLMSRLWYSEYRIIWSCKPV